MHDETAWEQWYILLGHEQVKFWKWSHASQFQQMKDRISNNYPDNSESSNGEKPNSKIMLPVA